MLPLAAATYEPDVASWTCYQHFCYSPGAPSLSVSGLVAIDGGQSLQLTATPNNFTDAMRGFIYYWYAPTELTESPNCYTPALYNSTSLWTYSNTCTLIANSSFSGTAQVNIEVEQASITYAVDGRILPTIFGSVSKSVSITVNPALTAPTISTPSMAAIDAGQISTILMTSPATGTSPAYQWLEEKPNASAYIGAVDCAAPTTISCRFTTQTAGTYYFELEATDYASSKISSPVSVIVNPEENIQTTSIPSSSKNAFGIVNVSQGFRTERGSKVAGATPDTTAFGIVNSTGGVGASPLFQLNYTSNTNINTESGFRTERGSKVAGATPDTTAFGIVNSTGGVGVSSFFHLNYTASKGQTNSSSYAYCVFAAKMCNYTKATSSLNTYYCTFIAKFCNHTYANATYLPQNGQSVNQQSGFRTERGSKVASITPSTLTIDLAKTANMLNFAIGPSNSTVKSTGVSTIGPFGTGKAVTGFANLAVSAVNATPILSGASKYTIRGISNITATTSVSSATVPVLLKNMTASVTIEQTTISPYDSQIQPPLANGTCPSGYAADGGVADYGSNGQLLYCHLIPTASSVCVTVTNEPYNEICNGQPVYSVTQTTTSATTTVIPWSYNNVTHGNSCGYVETCIGYSCIFTYEC